MSLDSDVIVDRRRMRRKLTFWRVAAVVIAIAAIAVVGALVSPGSRGTFTSSGSIARVNIEGLIRSDQRPRRGAGAAGEVAGRRRHRSHQFARAAPPPAPSSSTIRWCG